MNVNPEGLIPLLGGLYAYLLARGFLRATKDPVKNDAWLSKWGPALKWLAPPAMLFGLTLLTGVI
ncbi:MAG: hypothetical protein PVG35_18945 [Desulfobacterales bacterium]|jgi:hypothetical protein